MTEKLQAINVGDEHIEKSDQDTGSAVEESNVKILKYSGSATVLLTLPRTDAPVR